MLKHNFLQSVSLLHVCPILMCIDQKRYIGLICYLSFILINIIRYKYTKPYNYRYVVLFSNRYYNWLDFIGNECRIIYSIHLFYISLNFLRISLQDNFLLKILFNKRIYLIAISLASYWCIISIVNKKYYIPIGSDRHQKYEFIQICVDFVGSVSLLYTSY